MDGPRREKPRLWGFAKNKDAYKPAHPRSINSAFVSIISILAASEISTF